MATRTLTVERNEAGWTVAEWLRVRLKVSRSTAGRLVQGRNVRLSGKPCTNPSWRLRAGQRVEVHLNRLPSSPGRRPSPPPRSESPRGLRPLLQFVDEHIVVVEKP